MIASERARGSPPGKWRKIDERRKADRRTRRGGRWGRPAHRPSMKEGEAAKAAEVKEEPMETEDGAEAVPKENGESAEEGGEKADAETAGKTLN